MIGKFAQAVTLLKAVLREVFDESAYQRFLLRARLTPSAESYAAFRLEHEKAKAARPRCC